MQRRTVQRDAIRGAIERAGRPLAPAEVLELAAADAPTLGLATVYRALRALEDSGEIVAVDVPGQPPRYERAGLDHHHHFQCDVCGRLFDLPGCPGNVAALAPEGFAVERHEITLFGTCAECA